MPRGGRILSRASIVLVGGRPITRPRPGSGAVERPLAKSGGLGRRTPNCASRWRKFAFGKNAEGITEFALDGVVEALVGLLALITLTVCSR